MNRRFRGRFVGPRKAPGCDRLLPRCLDAQMGRLASLGLRNGFDIPCCLELVVIEAKAAAVLECRLAGQTIGIIVIGLKPSRRERRCAADLRFFVDPFADGAAMREAPLDDRGGEVAACHRGEPLICRSTRKPRSNRNIIGSGERTFAFRKRRLRTGLIGLSLNLQFRSPISG